MTGGNDNPMLCIGGPKDGAYYTLQGATQQLTVYESESPLRYQHFDSSDPDTAKYMIRTTTYHRFPLLGEVFLVHETLHHSSYFPRNVMAALKNGYKVIK